MFLTAVEDRAHALSGASVVIEKVLNTGEGLIFLYLAILQIIIARIANARVVGVDLFAPVHFVFAHRAAAAKSHIVAPAMSVVGGHIDVNFIAVEIAGSP